MGILELSVFRSSFSRNKHTPSSMYVLLLTQVMCTVNEQLRNFDKTGIKGDGRTTAELSFEQGLRVSIELPCTKNIVA